MMRLGQRAVVRSKQAGEVRWHYIKFLWAEFNDPNRFLDEVEVSVERGDRDEASVSGTLIEIAELNAFWTTEKDCCIHSTIP
jgi:hypothetical protein